MGSWREEKGVIEEVSMSKSIICMYANVTKKPIILYYKYTLVKKKKYRDVQVHINMEPYYHCICIKIKGE